METGERQVAKTLDGIREDHLARYRFVINWLKERFPEKLRKDGSFRKGQMRVMDLGCGVGYGAVILAEAGCQVLAVDNSDEALAFGREHYGHEGVTYVHDELATFKRQPGYHAAVCFEVLEHMKAPGQLLGHMTNFVPLVFASTPNESVFPHRGMVSFHERHYTAQEFEGLMNETGWAVREWLGQAGPVSDLEPNTQGRTLVVVAEADRNPMGGTHEVLPAPPPPPPESIAIVAQGYSKISYVSLAMQMGGDTKQAFDEIWAINSMGGVIKHDRLFHMDDVLVQEERARLNPEVKGLIETLKGHPGPIYTSTTSGDCEDALAQFRVQEGQEKDPIRRDMIREWITYLEEASPRYAKYDGLVSYPLGEVVTSVGAAYLNNTVAMALAMAMHLRVKEITLFGADYTYPDAHIAEKGRACVENLIGMCARSGITVKVPPESTLMDANAPDGDRWYGYDAWTLELTREDGQTHLRKHPKKLPTAEEMEERYRKIPKELEA